MSSTTRHPALDRPIAERWRQLLSGLDHTGTAQLLRAAASRHADQPSHLTIREIFVRSESDQRRAFDLLCIALVERQPRSSDGGPAHELYVFGPERLRGQTVTTTAGMSVNELHVASAEPGLRSISLIVLGVPRGTRTREIATSIEDLGGTLNYRLDVEGSTMIGQAVIRRLETLVATPGVRVIVAGASVVDGDGEPGELYSMLTPNAAPIDQPDGGEIRDGQIVTVSSDGSAVVWRGADFVLIRVGPRARRAENRSLHQLRREHAAAQVAIGSDEAAGENQESYSARAAKSRQASRAERVVRLALESKPNDALAVLRTALSQPDDEGVLAEGIANRIDSTAEYWRVHEVIEPGHFERAGQAVGEAALEVRTQMSARLDRLLGFDEARISTESVLPVVTPIVFEANAILHPIVDANQDGGRFLRDLIPKMRDRVAAGTGVTLPGVRTRDNPNLFYGGFSIKVMEVPVHSGSISPEAIFGVASAGDTPPQGAYDLTYTHPRSGEYGLWRVEPIEGPASQEQDTIDAQEYLIYQIELAARAHLYRYLGIQEVQGLLDTWGEAGAAELITATVGDLAARLRLTWLLQSLLADGIPITDWRQILRTIETTGGIGEKILVLHRAIRLALRDQIQRVGRGRLIPVPLEMEERLIRTDTTAAASARLEFVSWLQTSVSELGPAIGLVAQSDTGREAIARLARSQHRLITTFTAAEVEP